MADCYVWRFGLAVTGWRVIAVLGRLAGLSANGVAVRTAMDKVAVSRAVARLLERGLLEREVHGDDRRRSVLALSEAGYGIHDEVAPLAQAFEQKLLAGMEAPERELLFRRSEEHTSELKSLMRNTYADFCLNKQNKKTQ